MLYQLCFFCKKECKNLNSHRNHERLCPLNPNRVHPGGMKGKKHSEYTRKKMSNNSGSKKMSLEMRAEYAERARKRNQLYFSDPENRRKYSITACNRLKKHSKYSKNIPYGSTILESTYELMFAKQLDLFEIKWIKCYGTRFEYTDKDGKRKGYVPDFLLTEYQIYVDTKNDYLIKKDLFKINAVRKEHNLNLHIFSLEDIINEKIKEILPTVAQGEQGAL